MFQKLYYLSKWQTNTYGYTRLRPFYKTNAKGKPIPNHSILPIILKLKLNNVKHTETSLKLDRDCNKFYT